MRRSRILPCPFSALPLLLCFLSTPADAINRTAVATAANATIHCFHIHVYFLERNAKSTAHALALRDEFIQTFFAPGADDDPATGRPGRRSCTAEVNEEFLCLWGSFDSAESSMNMKPVGPHTYGSWGASMPNDYYNRVVPWVFASKQAYPDLAGILLHPLTAPLARDTRLSRRRDHEWGIWTETTLPLDYDFLYHNVYDCDKCDPDLCTQACPHTGTGSGEL